MVNSQTAETNALNGYIKARNNMDLVLGRLLEANRVDLDEAYQGKVHRAPDPLPVLGHAEKIPAALAGQTRR